MKTLPLLTFLTVVLLLSGVSHAEPVEFTQHLVRSQFLGAEMIDVVDMDGDKDPDIIATTETTGEIVWFENDTTGFHFVFHPVTVQSNPSRVIGSDIDMDGDVDILCAFDYGDRIDWYERIGHNEWIEHTILSDYSEARSMSVADLDGDEDLDIAVCGQWTVSWLENDGSQNYTLHHIDSNIPGCAMVAARDFDIDGDKDIFAVAYWWGEAAYYVNGGAGNFDRITVDGDIEDPHWMEVVDIDNDNDLDILASSRGENEVILYRNLGGAFAREVVTQSISGPEGISAADFDLDGDNDFIVLGRSGGDITFFDNQVGGWESQVIQEGFGMPVGIDEGDFDLDGDMDFAATFLGDDMVLAWENAAADNIGPADEFYIDLIPDESTTTVPAEGGTVIFDVEIYSPLNNPISGYAWMDIQLPNGAVLEGFGSWPIVVQPGATVFENRSLTVPMLASPGNYVIYGHIGQQPLFPIDTDSFVFTKENWWAGPPAHADAGDGVWSLHGLDDRTQPLTLENSLVDLATPRSFELSRAWPNPFNPTTTFSLTLPQAADVTVTLYNMRGQVVREIVDGDLSAGTHTFMVQGDGLAVGTYFLRAAAGDETRIQKLVYLK